MVGDQTFTFIVSGMLWRNSLIMQDKETKSYWSHVTGKAIIGKMEGASLKTLPMVQTTWSLWVKEHPQTKVLKKDHWISSSSYEQYFRDPNRTGLFRSHWLMEKMPGKNIVHGITSGPHALAITEEKLKRAGEFIQPKIGEEPIIVVRERDGGVRAYSRKLGNRILIFKSDSGNGVVNDIQTNSVWNLETGLCTSGSLTGSQLTEKQVTVAFWFAWSSFYPHTKVID